MLESLFHNPANLCTVFEYNAASELIDVINTNPVLGSAEEIIDYIIIDDFLIRT